MNRSKLFTTQEIIAGASSTSEAIRIRHVSGFFSIYFELTGDGTATVEYLLSHDGITYLTPVSATEIKTGFVKTSGNGSDGKDIIPFEPELAPFMKIKITETGSADTITVTMSFLAQ